MELWAAGFNAWGQLNFEEESEEEPRDFREFICILKEERIEIIYTTLSATLVKTSTKFRVAGCADNLIELCLSKQDSLPHLALAGNDKVISQHGFEQQTDTEPGKPQAKFFKQYSSLNAYLKNHGDDLTHLKDGDIIQVVAGQCTFAALSGTGEIWTWGDGRYEACFGRETSEDKPATNPCIVEDLSDLPTGPIRKISSGGYITAALTEGNDLYMWGGRAGQAAVLDGLTGTPTPVDIEGEDILDVAVGMDHILALTSTRRLFVVGSNGNGQLGLDVESLASWREVSLPLTEGQQIASVHAGYKNSLVVAVDII